MPDSSKSFVHAQISRDTSRHCLMAGAFLATVALAACENAPRSEGRFMSRTQTPVYRITDTSFEVGLRPGQPFRFFWCSAADYARKTQDAGWNVRIYVLRGLGKGRLSGTPDSVEFSLEPVDQAPHPSVRLSFVPFEVGGSRSVSSAHGECSRPFRVVSDD